MTVTLNHTIIHATDKRASAMFLAGILGLDVEAPWGPFIPVRLANGVELELVDDTAGKPQHHAFLLSEDEFDAAYGRLLDRRVRTWADPSRTRPAEISHNHGGRGVCFDDPDGHLMEIFTQPRGPEAD